MENQKLKSQQVRTFRIPAECRWSNQKILAFGLLSFSREIASKLAMFQSISSPFSNYLTFLLKEIYARNLWRQALLLSVFKKF